jgi:hypothetical protein
MRKDRALLSLFVTILTLISLSAFTKPATVLAAGECGGPYPPKPAHVWASPGPSAGTVKLSWNEVSYADRYAVAYGTQAGKYLYGADNIGGSGARSYTVGGLTPGVTYHFVLAGAHGCASSPFSAEVAATATSGEVTMAPVRVGAPVVSGVSADAHHVWTNSGPGVGEVTLHWNQVEDADDYHLVYGTIPGKNEYGALNIGKDTRYTVRRLVPGKTYYFSIVPVKNGRAGSTTLPVAGTAMAPVVEVVVTNPEAVMPPPTFPPVTDEQPMTPPLDTPPLETVNPTTPPMDVPPSTAVQGEQTEQPPQMPPLDATMGTVTDPSIPTVEPTVVPEY